MTKAEWKAEKLSVLGPDLGEYYCHLWEEMHAVRLWWHELTRIFGQGPEIVDLVNSVAPLYFNLMLGSQWREVVLSICTFSDKATISGNSTVSFKGLRKLVSDQLKQQELLDAIQRFEVTLIPIWLMRDKSVAHWDAEVVLGKVIPSVSIDEVETSLKAAGEFMNVFERTFGLYRYDYTKVLDPIDGTTAMLMYLRAGKTAMEEGME